MENIQELIKKFGVRKIIVDGRERLTCRHGISAENMAYLKSRVDEIFAEFRRQEEAETERRRKIDAIDGIKEITAARESIRRYHAKFSAAFNRECVQLPEKPNVDLEALYAKFPRAVAYLTAESYTESSNYRKNAIGKKALERIINGEDCETVIQEMKAEWANATAELID